MIFVLYIQRAPEDGFQRLAKYKGGDGDDAPLMADKDADIENQSGAIDQASTVTFTEEERWKRIVQNDLENIPITITLMWVAYICGGDNVTNIVLASLFTLGRIMHTICYIYSLMPWRSFAWLFGIIGSVGFMINAVYGVYADNHRI